MQADHSTIEKKSNIPPKNDPIIVVCSADDNYAMQVAVTGRSILANLKGDRHIILYILDGGITDPNKKKILTSLKSEKCEVKFISDPGSLLGEDIEDLNKRLGPDGKTISEYLSIATFFRLVISELLPPEIEKVIYLDCDLVVTGDLEQLWETELGENYLLAAQDSWVRTVSNPNGLLNYQELGLEPDAKYFNGGVLVLNLKKWRTDGISAKSIEYLNQKRAYIRWHDQDVLNALLAHQWGELSPQWNMSPISIYGYASWQDSPYSEEVYTQLIRDPYIMHYVSDKKPWTSRHTPGKEHFFKYVDMTEWTGWRLTIWKRFQLRWAREVRNIKKKLIS